MYAPASGTKSARRWGSEPTLRPRPSQQAGCSARLDRGEEAQRKRTRGQASKQQAAKGPRGRPPSPESRTLQLRLCPRGPPSRPSQTKTSGAKKPPLQSTEAPDPISQEPKRAQLPASSGTLEPGAGSGRSRRPGAPWEAGPGARPAAGVRSGGWGWLWPPRRRFRGYSVEGGGTVRDLPRSGPLKPLHRAACRAPTARGTKEPLPRRVRSPRRPADGSALRAPELQLHPTRLRALCPRRGGKDGRTLKITDGARAPKLSPERAARRSAQSPVGHPFILGGRRAGPSSPCS